MPDEVPLTAIMDWMRAYARILSEQRDYLTKLDSPIGDADHGFNMDRGFTAVVAQLDDAPPLLVGDLFNKVGMTLISTVGGASGPLYGTLFVRMAAASGESDSITAGTFVSALDAGVEGVVALGKAELGDKTMVDTLRPSVDELANQVSADVGLAEALASSAMVAENAMKSTIPMLARKGRASYLGERSIGHQDPGATSAYYLMKSAAEVINGMDQPRQLTNPPTARVQERESSADPPSTSG